MPTDQAYDSGSVMYNEMPKPQEIAGEGFMEKWGKLHEVRDNVLKALEEARNAKIIGKPQEAKVCLTASDDLYDFLKGYEKDLPTLFIVSQVSLEKGEGNSSEMEGLSVTVEKASGNPCPRCWNYGDTVGKDEKHPEVCARCGKILG